MAVSAQGSCAAFDLATRPECRHEDEFAADPRRSPQARIGPIQHPPGLHPACIRMCRIEQVVPACRHHHRGHTQQQRG
ncbi:hypothetical protein RZS08_35120, partial [Arthrospira platensis SPKY1]|nr:hypothetical protein [Arthrospira platensis SPKY1]